MGKQKLPATVAGIGLLILILDTKTAIAGASAGVEICLQTLIPSLFPFLFLSAILLPSLQGQNIPLLRPLGRLLHIPEGAESLFLIGLLGGYPIGAQSTAQAVKSGSISRENGRRLLAFCSNAGPAFLFGIGSRIFEDIGMCWALWGIHILSAVLVGILLPGRDENAGVMASTAVPKPAQALKQAVQTMAHVCGWVVLFRIVTEFSSRWFLWLLPVWAQAAFCGLLELSNGCCALVQILDVAVRFILCSGILAFGGLCVGMQTYSVCDGVDASWYLPGKLLQAAFSICMSCLVISQEMRLPAAATLAALLGGILIFRTKNSSNLRKYIV